jgi:hypothetical protein
MIRTETVASKRNIDLLADFIDAFPSLAVDVVETALRKDVLPGFYDDLRYTPGAAKNGLNSGQPFVWSTNKVANDRARKWFFANYPQGYTRTGEFARGWQITFNEGLNNISMSVSNSLPAAGYIVGNVRTGAGQIPGHARTGHALVYKTIDFWSDAAIAVATDAITALIDGRP